MIKRFKWYNGWLFYEAICSLKYELECYVQVAGGASCLTHMFFADDTYIYCKARVDQTDHVLDLFKIFECASGQKINAEKLSVFFTRNTDSRVRNVTCNMLQFKEADSSTKYLGLPNIFGRNKTAVLGYLNERLKEKV